jgi:hypothetical protein
LLGRDQWHDIADKPLDIREQHRQFITADELRE